MTPLGQDATLESVLRARARREPSRRAFTFLEGPGLEEIHLSYGELDESARAIGTRLRDEGLTGERILLLYPPGLGFVAGFLGCLYGGAVAVPAYPPGSRRTLPRLRAIARDARPAAILTLSSELARFESLCSRLSELRDLRWLATDVLNARRAADFEPPSSDPKTTAFLQYTSGSTATPKGVRVTHGNLAHNEEMIRQAFGQTRDSVIVGWLPLYHDMGLVGNVLQPLWVGARCVLMSPVTFLQRPTRWLQTISRYRATTSGGPNFAFDLCARKVKPEDRARLDLSSWRVAFNGSEPVRAATLERFAEVFGPCGFRSEAFYPCYGLAEATLLVTAGSKTVKSTVSVAETELERGRVLPTADAAGRVFVGCGPAAAGVDLQIVDPETCELRPPDGVGEIWIAGPAVADGYRNRPEETEHTFGGRLAGSPRPASETFLRTGDLGFFRDGQLFVTGRLKDLIILRGRNLYPQDIEWSAQNSHGALQPDSGAAFSVDVGDEERLVVVHELKRRRHGQADAAIAAVRRALARDHDVQAYDVVLVRFASIPKTSSGKIRRRACRAAYLAGELAVVAAGRREDAGDPVPSLDRESLRALGEEDLRVSLTAYLEAGIGRAARLSGSEIDPRASLAELGLDSLAAAELRDAIESDLDITLPLSSLLEACLTELVEEILRRRRDGTAADAVGPPPRLVARRLPPDGGELEQGADHPLSAGQEALWFLRRLAPASCAYNLAAAARVRSGLDLEALGRALETLVVRHPMLRASFRERRGEPRQRFRIPGPESEPALEIVDGRDWTAERVRGYLADKAYAPYDLEAGPPFRAQVLIRPAGEHLVLFGIHHIAADFWSLEMLVSELGTLYALETGAPLETGSAATLAPLEVAYTDWVRWHQALLEGPGAERSWDYWRRRLEPVPRVLELATDRPRPPVQTYRGGRVPGVLDAVASARLRTLARTSGTTLFTVLLAAFQGLLARHSGQLHFLVGTPAAIRHPPGVAGVLGYFVNPLALEADLRDRPTFRQLLGRARRTVLEAFEHLDIPFARLAEQLHDPQDRSRSPLFQVMAVLHKARGKRASSLAAFALGVSGASLDLGGVTLESLDLEERGAAFDLTLTAAEWSASAEIGLALGFNSDLFDGTTARRFLEHFARFVAEIAADPDRKLGEVPFLWPAEHAQLLVEWNDTAASWTGSKTLHGLFEAQVARAPDATAVAFDEETVTYAALDARADRLMRRLRSLGIGPETRVALCVERTPRLVEAVLGILKAGAAYVPLDPKYPRERLALMVQDAAAPVVVADAAGSGRLPATSGRIVRLDDFDDLDDFALETEGGARWRAPTLDPDLLAYVLYTSGSTGRPKGVGIRHRSAAALVHWARGAFGPGEIEGVLAATSVCFDLSVFELFVPLSWGGRVVLAANALDLAGLPDRGRVTLINSVPSAAAALLRLDGIPETVRSVNLAGEPLSTDLVRQLRERVPGVKVRDLYGPSEGTTYSTWTVRSASGPATIGRPLGGEQAFVLDAEQRPVPAGAVGELYLAGVGLARGYLDRPARTAERFLPHLWSAVPGDRAYRTGDLVRYLPDGNLLFLGRTDHQVKVRGFRIELGEIEAALGSHPEVREAVAAVWEAPSGQRSLAAYVELESNAVRSSEPVAESALRRYLEERLPGFMVPGALRVLDELPRHPNGKVHRGALPAPEGLHGDGGQVAPRTPVEEILTGIWTEVLGLANVGVTDDFFALGGHSLVATRVVARIGEALGVELPVRALFETPTVAGLAERVQATIDPRGDVAGEAVAAIPPADRSAPLPLSFAQQRLWFLDRLEPGSAVYNVSVALELDGVLDAAALGASLNEVVRRHEALRTTFEAVDGSPAQVIGDPPASAGALPRIDLRRLLAGERESQAEGLARQAASEPFDLTQGPLLRVRLLHLGHRRHLLILVLHHIVCDGWSLGVLAREVRKLYGACIAGEPAVLPDLPLQYADYATWQRGRLRGGNLERLVEEGRRRLAGVPDLELPADRPRPAKQTFRGAVRPFRLHAELCRDLRRLSQKSGATLFMAMLAAFQVLLHRLSGQADVAVGTPVANRHRTDVEGLIGFFANTLVIRTDLSPGGFARSPGGFAREPRFSEVLARVRSAALAAYAYQDLPFEVLVEALEVERSLDRTPLFQVMLVLQNAPMETAGLTDLEMRWRMLPTATSKFDLTLSLTEDSGELRGDFEYSTDLFDGTRIGRLGKQLEVLLAAAVARPDSPLSVLPSLSAAERHEVLVEWNDTDAAPRRGGNDPLCLHELFEAQAGRSPEAVAVVGERLGLPAERLTYGELDARAERLAEFLRARGVGPDVPVGISLERGPRVAIALLAILKAGGAYLPLDPSYPADRLELMLDDAQPLLLLTEEALRERLWGAFEGRTEVICLDERAEPTVRGGPEVDTHPDRNGDCRRQAVPSNLGYVVFTSGSTGRPKGIALSHRALVNLIGWHGETLLSGARTLQFAPLSFDVSFKEMFSAWISGGSVFLVSEVVCRDVVALVRLVRAARVEKAILPVVVMQQLAEECLAREIAELPFREITTTGEQLHVTPAVRDFFRRFREVAFHNHYGPAETHVVTALALPPEPAGWPSHPSIGRPIARTRIHLLHPGPWTPRLQITPIGVLGELLIGGISLARGYLDRPVLTAEKFVPDPFAAEPGARLYRTGDLARYLPSGELEFLGRQDHQVKVRGFRIELGEVEGALGEHPAVAACAAAVAGGGTQEARLVAFVIAEPETLPAPAALADYLGAKLPAYMVPALFVTRDALPLTPSGKVDRRALAREASAADVTVAGERVLPRNPTEELLAGIWSEVLVPGSAGPPPIGVDDDFFTLGGHSLLATRVMSRIQRTFGVDLPVRTLFEAPTIAALATRVEAARRGRPPIPAPPLVPMARSEDPSGVAEAPLSHAQQRLWLLDQLEPGSAFYNLAGAVRFIGELAVGALAESLAEIVRRHEVLRTTFTSREDRGDTGAPVQRIHSPGSFDTAPRLPVVDLEGLDPATRETRMRRLAQGEAARPFDLERGPLLRGTLVRLGNDGADGATGPPEHVLVLTQHHIVSDGWSLGVLARELRELYGAFREGRETPVAELPLQYADYARWQRRWLREGGLDEQVAYWRKRLAGAEPLELPADRPRPTRRGFRGASRKFAVSSELTERLRRLGLEHGTTLFMTLLAAFSAFLQRVSDREDLCLGTPVAGRVQPELEGLIGFFVNTLVVRADVSGDPRGSELLASVRETTLETFARQDLPFDRLVEEVGLDRDLHRTPLVQVLFALQNAPLELALPSLVLRPLELDTGTSKFDLTFSFTETGDGLAGIAEYDTDLFDGATLQRWIGHFRTLVEDFAADPKRRLSELRVLSEAQRHQLASEWNAYRTTGPKARAMRRTEGAEPTLHGLFEAWVGRAPDAVAVASPAGTMTYGALDRRAGRVADRLRSLGIGPERTVGILVEQPAETAAGLLGILKAGGVCLPLDSQSPARRLAYMLRDAEATVLMTEGSAAHGLAGVAKHELRLEDLGEVGTRQGLRHDRPGRDRPGRARPGRARPGRERPVLHTENLAYMIYTSGTTGRPKGVTVSHASVLPLTRWSADYLHLGPETRSLQSLSVAFDFGFFEVLDTLVSGGVLHFLGAEDRIDVERYVDAVQERQIDTIQATPSFFREVVAQDREMPSLRNLHLGGEVLSPDLAHRIAELAGNCNLHNGYGPTESAVNSFLYRAGESASRNVALSGSLPIGKGSGRTLGYVTDRRGLLMPPGALGELWIGGPGVARGYKDRPWVTAAKFVPDPFSQEPGRRLYKTGDLVRHVEDGTLEFHGRMDHQVKIRGFRIELGEIESALSSQPGVEAAAVVVREEPPAAPRLAAYVVVAEGSALTVAERRRRLEEELPTYMVPAAIVELDALPRTPNGKLDRRALPAPRWDVPASASAAPSTPVEEILAGIWGDVLNRHEVGVHESFFDLGGHSLLATQAVSRIRRSFGIELPVRTLFEARTVAALAEVVTEIAHAPERREPATPRPAAPQPAAPQPAAPQPAAPQPAAPQPAAPLSFAQERLWILDRLEPGNPAYNISGPVALQGCLDAVALERSIAEVARRHATLRTAFREVDGAPVQVVEPVRPEAEAPAGRWLPAVDLRRLENECRRKQAEELARVESRRPFDLARSPLLRFVLLRVDDDRHLLVVSLHHVVGDGWSLGILIREIGALYEAFRAGKPSPLPELSIQYADFALWQRRLFESGYLDAQVDYWCRQLRGPLGVLELPADRQRPPIRTFRGRRVGRRLAKRLSDGLRSLSRREEVTLFMTLLAAFKVLLSRLSAETDVVVGSPIAGRTHEEAEGLIGFFLNTLVLRTDLSGDPTFRELLRRVREVALAAYAHQDLPFERLLEELQPERDLSRTPLFQVFFNMLNLPLQPLELADLTLEPVELPDALANFDLTLYVRDEEDGLSFDLVYNSDLFDRGRMQELLRQYQGLLLQIAGNPELRTHELSLLTSVAARRLPELGAPLDAGWRGAVHELVRARAQEWPDKIALIDGTWRWTYRQLVADVSRLARDLREQGIGRGDRVVVYGHRSAPLVAAILGTLAAGAVFVILDPAYPGGRLADVVSVAKPRGWIALAAAGDPPPELDESLRALPSCARLTLSRLRRPPADRVEASGALAFEVSLGPDDPACVVFTSGSTAKPKGILGRHGSLTHFTDWQCRAFSLDASDRFCLLSGLAHDPLQREIFTPLQIGASVAIPEPGELDRPARLAAWLARQEITVVHLTPAMGRVLTDSLSERSSVEIRSLRRGFFVGDVLTRRNLERLLQLAPGVCPINFYGSTETQRAVGYYPVPIAQAARGRGGDRNILGRETAGFEVMPLGRGIEDVQLLVLTRLGRLAGIGEVGEICVRSPHVALGYLGGPALTAERFTAHSFPGAGGERIYRTGDLGRYLPGGDVVFAGRVDQQVKVRGFRIELGEIESWLSRHPAVDDAVVAAWRGAKAGRPQGNDARLVAYVVPVGDPVPVRELREFLGERLPGFMVPAAFVTLDALPLTPNRKIDRGALPAPDLDARHVEYVAPRGPVEEELAAIWSRVLGIERIGVHDSFFDLGGHSLLATQVISRIYDTFQVEVRLQSFFTEPTVAGLAAAVNELQFARMDAVEQELLERIEHLSDEEIESELHRLQELSPSKL